MKQPFLHDWGTLTGTTTLYGPVTSGALRAADGGDATPEITNGELWAAPGTLGQLLIKRYSPANGGSFGPGTGITETYTLYINGIATAVEVAIADAANEGTYSGIAANVATGDIVCLKRVVTGGTPGDTRASVSILFNGTRPLRSVHGGNFNPNTGATRYIAPMVVSTTPATLRTDDFGSNIIGTYGDTSYHAVSLKTAPGMGKSWTFTLLRNGVAIAGSAITVADLATSGSATFSASSLIPVTVTAGVPTAPPDELSLKIEPSGTPAASRVAYGFRFDATPLSIVNDDMEVIAEINNNLSNYCVNQTTLAALSAGNYLSRIGTSDIDPLKRQLVWTDVDGVDFNVVLANMGVVLNAGPGGAHVRKFFPMFWDTTAMPPAFTDGVLGGASFSGSAVYSGVPTSGGATQFTSYGTGADARRFVIHQNTDGTIPDNATGAVWMAFMLFADTFTTSGATFDGTIVSIAPTSGPRAGGTAFTITGTGFQGTVNGGANNITGVSSVTLRGVAATSVVVVNDTTITGVSAESPLPGVGDVVVTFTTDTDDEATATATLADGWTYISVDQWWVIDPGDGTGPSYFYDDAAPVVDGVTAVDASDNEPDPYGWWASPDGLGGVATVYDGQGRPKAPRTIAKMTSFATGASGHLQGQGVAVVLRNKLIYANRDYTVSTDSPPIRLYDGASDRFLTRAPKDASGVVAEAVMSMMVANGTIYITTLDASAAGGRVFSFDLDTLTWTQLGAAFAASEVPYAMAWFMDRLWVGTNKHDGTAGKIYYIRPGIDAAFTTDRNLSTDTLGGVTSMAVYQGKLYIGTDNGAAVAAKIKTRDAVGVYANVETGAGTAVNNAYTSMVVFENKLYASYWDSLAPTSTIRRFDGSSWSTVYTGASNLAIPILAVFTHADAVYALFGKSTEPAGLISSISGDSGDWDELTSNLSPGNILATPAFASLRF